MKGSTTVVAARKVLEVVDPGLMELPSSVWTVLWNLGTAWTIPLLSLANLHSLLNHVFLTEVYFRI